MYFRKDLSVKVVEMTEDFKNTLRPTRDNDSGTTGATDYLAVTFCVLSQLKQLFGQNKSKLVKI